MESRRGTKRRSVARALAYASAAWSAFRWLLGQVGDVDTAANLYSNWPRFAEIAVDVLLWPPLGPFAFITSFGLFVYYDRQSRHVLAFGANQRDARLDIRHGRRIW